MKNPCFYCPGDLGDLNDVMDILSEDKLNGETEFTAQCCGKKIKAFSQVMRYYIVADGFDKRMIGAA